MLHELILGSGPLSWAALSLCVWLSYVFAQGVGNMGRWDRHHLIWGFLSIVHFMYYVLVIDQSFQVKIQDTYSKEETSEMLCFLPFSLNTVLVDKIACYTYLHFHFPSF